MDTPWSTLFHFESGNAFNLTFLVIPMGANNIMQRKSILAVGEVLQYYDTDKRFPAWGFGGRPIDGPVSHCFALNGNQQAAEVSYSLICCFIDLPGELLFIVKFDCG